MKAEACASLRDRADPGAWESVGTNTQCLVSIRDAVNMCSLIHPSKVQPMSGALRDNWWGIQDFQSGQRRGGYVCSFGKYFFLIPERGFGGLKTPAPVKLLFVIVPSIKTA